MRTVSRFFKGVAFRLPVCAGFAYIGMRWAMAGTEVCVRNTIQIGAAHYIALLLVNLAIAVTVCGIKAFVHALANSSEGDA